jgi:hypothetical protein
MEFFDIGSEMEFIVAGPHVSPWWGIRWDLRCPTHFYITAIIMVTF